MVMSSADGSVQFLRSVNGATIFEMQTFIVTIPCDVSGDVIQIVPIQVLNPIQIQAVPKCYPENFQIESDEGEDATALAVILPEEWFAQIPLQSYNDLDDFISRQVQQMPKEMLPELMPMEPSVVDMDSNGIVKKMRKYTKSKKKKIQEVHIGTASGGPILFRCPECQLAYSAAGDLDQHLSVHKIGRRYICDICGYCSKTKWHLGRHKLGHNHERTHICSVCKKCFKHIHDLKRHCKLHGAVKREICAEWGKGFSQKAYLRIHAKTHCPKGLEKEMKANVVAPQATTTIPAMI